MKWKRVWAQPILPHTAHSDRCHTETSQLLDFHHHDFHHGAGFSCFVFCLTHKQVMPARTGPMHELCVCYCPYWCATAYAVCMSPSLGTTVSDESVGLGDARLLHSLFFASHSLPSNRQRGAHTNGSAESGDSIRHHDTFTFVHSE